MSRGKDSLAMAIACKRAFKHVVGFHMVEIPGLSFVENYLDYLEKKLDMPILRVVHNNTWARLSDLIYQSPESSDICWGHTYPGNYWYEDLYPRIKRNLGMPDTA